MLCASIYNFQFGTLLASKPGETGCWASGPQSSHLSRTAGWEHLDRKGLGRDWGLASEFLLKSGGHFCIFVTMNKTWKANLKTQWLAARAL